MTLQPDEIALITRVLSIHRTSLRKRCGRLTTGSNEHRTTLTELRDTTALLAKFSERDLAAAG